MKFLSALVTCLTGMAVADTPPDANMKAVLDLHNSLRLTVNPPAASMPAMQWSNTLTTVAKNYAAKCIWGHNAVRTDDSKKISSQFTYVGENIAVRSGTSASGATISVQDFWNEKKDYTYNTNTCAAGAQCGHYTQMAWAASTFVGCAVQICPTMSGITWCAQYGGCMFLVCNYGPGGNFNGAKPYALGSGSAATLRPTAAPAATPTAAAATGTCTTTAGVNCVAIPAGFSSLNAKNKCFNWNGRGLYCFTGAKTSTGSYVLARCSAASCAIDYDKLAPQALGDNAADVNADPPIAPTLSEEAVCGGGTWLSSAGTCVACPAATVSAPNSTECTTCGTGTAATADQTVCVGTSGASALAPLVVLALPGLSALL